MQTADNFPPNTLLLHLGATRYIPTVAEAKNLVFKSRGPICFEKQVQRSSIVTKLGVTGIHVYVGLLFTRSHSNQGLLLIRPMFEV